MSERTAQAGSGSSQTSDSIAARRHAAPNCERQSESSAVAKGSPIRFSRQDDREFQSFGMGKR
jgi:hypothetical protein